MCNYLSWTGSSGVTYSVYSNSTSPVPIDKGHRVTNGITETNYTDCGKVNDKGESGSSKEDRASTPVPRGAVRVCRGDGPARSTRTIEIIRNRWLASTFLPDSTRQTLAQWHSWHSSRRGLAFILDRQH